jgi:L,D-peptidoglycan transpeptidase YkuD (ErfK/YbiS/YcfS/YnhG family)
MIIVNNKGELWYKKKRYKCAYGKNGFTRFKKEGDGCTPIGTFDLQRLFVRTDRIKSLYIHQLLMIWHGKTTQGKKIIIN